jgi:hypothetical protein
MRQRSATSLVALIALASIVLVPAAADARKKPKLYSVSLSGSTRTDVSDTSFVSGDSGCLGEPTETKHFVGGGTMVPKPKGVPFASYGRLVFNAKLKSLSATATDTVQGTFTPDPNAFGTPDCRLPPNQTGKCTFAKEATARKGAEFALLPNKGKFELYYNRTAGIVDCTPHDVFDNAKIFAGFVQTPLRASTVKGLGVGGSASASGKATFPNKGGSRSTGGETDTYKLKVKRVQ